jgi:hypothetical protein
MSRSAQQLFLGIDQTGARNPRNGRARPLAVVLLAREGQQVKALPLWLERFTKEELLNNLYPYIFGRDLSSLTIAVDAVLGLPLPVAPKLRRKSGELLWQLFSSAAQFSLQDEAFGSAVAEAFFTQIWGLQRGPTPPQRQVEKLVGANSLFQKFPKQKNIACGTFRIWKELGESGEPWANFFGFDPQCRPCNDGPWILEAYPSLSWKLLTGHPRSQGFQGLRSLEEAFLHVDQKLVLSPKLQSLGPDHLDALLIACHAYLTPELNKIYTKIFQKGPFVEGWILGAEAYLTSRKIAARKSSNEHQFIRNP